MSNKIIIMIWGVMGRVLRTDWTGGKPLRIAAGHRGAAPPSHVTGSKRE